AAWTATGSDLPGRSPLRAPSSGALARLAAPGAQAILGIARMQPQPLAGEVLAEHAALQQRDPGRPLRRTDRLAPLGAAGEAQDHDQDYVHLIARSRGGARLSPRATTKRCAASPNTP